jgi:hypothetical protein
VAGGGGYQQQNTAGGNNNHAGQGFQGINNNNNFQGAGANPQVAGNGFTGNVLPATQGLGTNGNNQNNQGSCPVVSQVPPVEQCAGRLSNCWSVGQPDVDCLNDALCCFDGCANVCQGAGPIPQPAQPPTPLRPAAGNNFAVAAAQPAVPAPAPRPRPTPAPAAPRPAPAPAAPRPAAPRPVQPPAPRPDNNFQGNNNNNFGGASSNNIPANNNNNQNAAQKPYVSCPAAMKCVLRVNCDFNGVMTDQVLDNLTPELEMLRVPLIPCINRERNNNVDVCCRDPNYQDPWPNMNGNGGMKNMNNGGGGNGNNQFQNGNNNNPGNNSQGNNNNTQGAAASNNNQTHSNNNQDNNAIIPRKNQKKKGYGR